ncbi:unnamed protein product [Closterium sp. NIES-53]
MHLVARASHQWLPMGMMDHKYAVRVRLVWRGLQETGPGVWRFSARLAKKPGVKAAIDDVVRKQGEGGCVDFDKLLRCLSARLRKYDKEERKRVTQTRKALEVQVDTLQQRVMADPGDDELQALLTTREAMLKRYWDGRRNLLQTRTGLKVQLDGEAPTGLLSALVKSRKAKTGIKELVRGGTPRRVLEDASAEELTRDWTEREVRRAIKELANDKSPGKDGLPKELYQVHWESLKGPVMKMVKDFMVTGNLPEVANEAITVLLYKQGDETDVRNYRPITLLTSTCKILAKMVASRMKKVLSQVISGEQYGFLPGKRLTDTVSLVADLIDTTKNKNSDWYLLLIDFEKAYDLVRRNFMLETIAKLGFPPWFVGWIEALHRDVHTRLCVNDWPPSRLVEEQKLGIGEDGCERLAYVGYADDTTLLLDGEHQLKMAEQVLKEFADVSGEYLLWKRVETLVENFVRGNHADTERHFRLWSGDLIYAPREQSGLGVVDPRGRMDSDALRCVGLALLQECPLRRGMTESAEDLPLGWATLYAHKAVLRGGLFWSRRWAKLCKTVLKLSAVKIPDAASRWDVAGEYLCFNSNIPHRGKAPFGGQKGTELIRKWRVQDMIVHKWDGTVTINSEDVLTRELGDKKGAEMALKAFYAAPARWREWLLAPLTVEEFKCTLSVVSTTLPSRKRCLWEVCGINGRKVVLQALNGSGERVAWNVRLELRCERVTPVRLYQGRVAGDAGDPRVRLLETGLFYGREVAPLRKLREPSKGAEAVAEKRAKWEARAGRSIDWERGRRVRDSLAVPARARDVLLRVQNLNLQVGERVYFLGGGVTCPHCGGTETLEHCLLECPHILPVVAAVKSALCMMQPGRHVDELADLLLGTEETKSGFSEATMVARAVHQIWLGRCDMSLKKIKKIQARKYLPAVCASVTEGEEIEAAEEGKRGADSVVGLEGNAGAKRQRVEKGEEIEEKGEEGGEEGDEEGDEEDCEKKVIKSGEEVKAIKVSKTEQDASAAEDALKAGLGAVKLGSMGITFLALPEKEKCVPGSEVPCPVDVVRQILKDINEKKRSGLK